MSGTGRMERKITALLSLLAVALLAHTLLLQPPPRGATVVFTDRVLSTFRFDGRQLVNRRNMILLCNAILLVILKDAGLLAAPARRRASDSTTAAGRDRDHHCSEAPPKPKSSTVEMRLSSTAAAGASDDDAGGRLKRRGPGPDKTTARLRRGKPASSSSGPAHTEYPAVRDIDQRPERCLSYHHGVVGTEIAAAEGACLHSQPVADDERSRGREETEPECVDDVHEMNRKFEEFIASTRRKMQLESRQLVKVWTAQTGKPCVYAE
uniref:Uncharacterized protein n=1 Tax=Avena sativa TaxID=4498 RepID=A0ACD5ZA48_AVESA